MRLLSTTLCFRETFEYRRAMRLWHNKRITARSSNLFQYLRDVDLPILGKPSHLLNGVFENFRHGAFVSQIASERETPFRDRFYSR